MPRRSRQLDAHTITHLVSQILDLDLNVSEPVASPRDDLLVVQGLLHEHAQEEQEELVVVPLEGQVLSKALMVRSTDELIRRQPQIIYSKRSDSGRPGGNLAIIIKIPSAGLSGRRISGLR